MRGVVALVVAKAPVAGQVKTRLGATVGDRAAAGLAAAALLDTFAACERAFGADRCAVAWTGELADAQLVDGMGEEIAAYLGRWTPFEQRGADFAARLLHAHQVTSARFGRPVLQIGMDTPQVDPSALREVADPVDSGAADAVLAPAYDGGWWALAVNSPVWVAGLESVRMSTRETADHTRNLLVTNGARVATGPTLRDVDTAQDAEAVCTLAPGSAFGRAWRSLDGYRR